MDIAQNKELNKKKRFIKKFFPVFNPLRIKIVKDDKLAKYISNKIHERCFYCIRYCCYLYGFITIEQYYDDTISRENSINTLYNICKLWHDIGDVFGLADRWKNNNLSHNEISVVVIFFGLKRLITAYENLLEKNILACLQKISMFDITAGYEITSGEISNNLSHCLGIEQMQQQMQSYIENIEKRQQDFSNGGKNSAKTRSKPKEKGFIIWKNNNLNKYKTKDALEEFKNQYQKTYGKKPCVDDGTITKRWFRDYKKRILK